MLALCKPYQKFEYLTVRDLPRLTLEAGEDFDDDDYRPRSSRRDFWDSWAPGSLSRHLRKSGW